MNVLERLWHYKTKMVILVFLLLLMQQNVDAQVLTHGPFPGGVTESSARFYLRVEPAGNANIRLAKSTDFSNAIIGTPIPTTQIKDFTALIKIAGLEADQLYYYQAVINGTPVERYINFVLFLVKAHRHLLVRCRVLYSK